MTRLVDVGQVASAFRFACIFWAGMAFRALPTQLFWKKPPGAPFIAHSLLFAFALFMGAQEGAAFSVASIALWPVVRLAGIAMVVAVLGRVFIRFGVAENRQRVLTKSCFGIYLFHQQVIQVVISLLNAPSVPPLALALACFAVSPFRRFAGRFACNYGCPALVQINAILGRRVSLGL